MLTIRYPQYIDKIHPTSNHDVRNCSNPIDSYTFETFSGAEHAATKVPNPGKKTFKTAATTATGLLTLGTFVTKSHTYLSTSSSTITLFYRCDFIAS